MSLRGKGGKQFRRREGDIEKELKKRGKRSKLEELRKVKRS